MYTHKALMFAVLMASISAAQAGPPQLREARVPYSDVNIGSKAGNAVMLGRIRAASREVCAPKPSLRDAQAYVEYQRCVAHSMEQAMADFHTLQQRAANEKAQAPTQQR